MPLYSLEVGDVIEITVACRTDEGQNQSMVLHYRVAGIEGTGASLQDVLAERDATFGPLLQAMLPEDSSYAGVMGRRVQPNPTQLRKQNAAAGAGELEEDALPAQIAGLITFISDNAPPRVFSRHYVPSTGEGQNSSSGEPSSGYKTLMGTLALAMTSSFEVESSVGNGVGLDCVIYRSIGNLYWTVTGYRVGSYWATQRRRGEGNRGDRPII